MALFSSRKSAARNFTTMAQRLRFEPLETRLAMAFTPVGAPMTVDGNHAGKGDVAMDAQGNFVAVWSEVVSGEFPNDVRELYGRRFDRLGNPLGATFQINTLENNPQEVRIDMAPDGRFVVAWQSYSRFDNNPSHNQEIFSRLYTAAGVPIGIEQRGSLPETGGILPSVAMNNSGQYILTWQWVGIVARKFDANGQPLTGEIIVSNFPCNPQLPSIDLADDGQFVASWMQCKNGLEPGSLLSDSRVRRFDSIGTPIGAEIAPLNVLDNADSTVVSYMTGNATDGIVVGYSYYSSPVSAFLFDYRTYLGQDAVAGPAINISSNPRGPTNNKDIQVKNGVIVATWQVDIETEMRAFEVGGVPLSSIIAIKPKLPNELGGLLQGAAFNGSSVVVMISTGDVSENQIQRFSSAPLAGDINGDDRVDLRDFVILRNHFGQANQPRYQGDLTGDGKVDLADFAVLRTNFGRKAEQALLPKDLAAMVPGPTHAGVNNDELTPVALAIAQAYGAETPIEFKPKRFTAGWHRLAVFSLPVWQCHKRLPERVSVAKRVR